MTTAAYRVTFQAAQNEDLRQAFALRDSAGEALYLTGAELRMDIRHPTTKALAATCGTGNGRVVVAVPADGVLEIVLPAAVLTGIAPGEYKQDMLMTQDGRTRRLWVGTLRVLEGVTQ